MDVTTFACATETIVEEIVNHVCGRFIISIISIPYQIRQGYIYHIVKSAEENMQELLPYTFGEPIK